MRKDTIREGDIVRVVVPRAVARVGYPKTPADNLADVCEKHETALREIFGYKTARSTLAESLYKAPSIEDRVANMPRPLQRVLHDLAYLACKREGFGGKERRVHLSEPMPDWKGAEFKVAGVRSAVEGDYYPPSRSYDYWSGAREDEPGGLENQRVRRLVTVGRVLTDRRSLVSMSRARDIEFPVEHLAKVSR